MIDYDALERIVREAGDIAEMGWAKAGDDLKVWQKGNETPVSESDYAVDHFLKDRLGKLLPSAGWLSEETTDDLDRLDNDLIWLVDPIDGTRDFVRGRTGWCISVALINNNRPLVGMLYAPARKEFWMAKAGKGATRNSRKLKASTRTRFPGARVPAADLMKIDQILTKVEQPNSIALRMAMVAADEADLVATLRWGHEWDIGAAALIAREAGARVTDAWGEPFHYNSRKGQAFGVLCCAPAIHEAAVEHLRDRAEAVLRRG